MSYALNALSFCSFVKNRKRNDSYDVAVMSSVSKVF
jgi:hypothetical protein